MKNLSLLLWSIFFATLVGCVKTSTHSVPFTTTSRQFVTGDSIVLEEVIAPSADLQLGEVVSVRGTYSLQSQSRATLGFFMTTAGPSEATPVSPAQRKEIVAGSGRFELKEVISARGSLHVSFYPTESGSSFGGVCFALQKP